MSKFEDMNLKKELLDALKRMNFIEPTDIQEMTIPAVLQGKSVLVKSKTGSGKTGAYLIPLINGTEKKKAIQDLILLPTRELAMQVYDVFKKMASNAGLKGALVYGGASINRQAEDLRMKPAFVIGTPGRIKDMVGRGFLNLSGVKNVVLDEADQMLDMGFYDDVSEIIEMTNPDRRMLLFSATMTPDVKDLASRFMEGSESINASEDEVPVDIKHDYVVSEHQNKVDFLVRYIEDYNPEKAIIFSNTKSGASFISDRLRKMGYRSVQIHGDLTQRQREDSIRRFRAGERFLVATDVAARGMDIPSITHIINYDLPREDKTYIHRVGRTARFGKAGTAMSIILPDEKYILNRIRKTAGVNIEKLPMEGQAQERRKDEGGRSFRSPKTYARRPEYKPRERKSSRGGRKRDKY
ncbi:DEAD/DEAH box helicase [Cuniculiplasma sp. SKW4]|uniref:DEAD/DEAH box helicase n=1 Tax=Cuniculiplasma sp. SKW4 TaxID=3400171 RepID=UPI003FD22E21